ncbi:MAG: rubredoxin [Clostridiales bacterium]|nr:rubredoxin [Clostridiales bacterium]
MNKYVCTVCGFIYDEEEGDLDSDIEPGTLWEEVPDEYVCPMCGVGKEFFELDEETDLTLDDE